MMNHTPLTMRMCIRLLERWLAPDLADHVTGDLIEQRERGILWMLGETLSALWHLHARPQPGDGFVHTFLADLRIAARLLRRSPAFAIVSVITLGLAIGATTAIFSVIEPVLLRPLPYPSPEQLTFVWERNRDGTRENVGFATFHDLAEQSKTIERSAAIGSWEPTLSGNNNPERVSGDRVSWTYFRTLGVKPALGRDFVAEEDVPGHNQFVILSDGLWRRRFGADSSIIGKPIAIDGNPMTVVGVMPASFDNVASPTAQIWRALGYLNQPFACRTCHHLRMIARIRPNVSMAAVQLELDQIHARLEKEYPKDYASIGAKVVSVQDEMTRDMRPALLALSAAVFLVLLIAVANVVSLQLARAIRRGEEFAVREALGAGRSRLLQQLLTEGLLLAALGGIVGLGIAYLSLPLLVARLPVELPRLSAIHLNTASLAATTGVVLALAIVMGLAPSRRRGADLGSALRSGRRLSGGSHHATRASLVVAEVALAVMLLVSAGLMGRSLVRLLGVNAGFDATHLLTLEINSTGANYRTNESIYAYHDRVREAVGAIPGVKSVAVSNQIPLGGNVDMYGVIDPDNVPANPELAPAGDRYTVSTNYLATMRIPVLAGRGFVPTDAMDTTNKIALVSTALAHRLWPNESALGKRIRIGAPEAPARTIVGVTGNVRHRGLDATTTQQLYIPERQLFFADNQEILIVRAEGDPAALAGSVRQAIAAIDPTQPIIKIATMDQVVAASTSQRRLALVLFGAFATAALLLAIAGIYGVLAGSVAERTREIGVRSALGATPSDIVALVVGQGGRLAVVGIVLGLAGSFALTRYLQSMLFGVAPNDPVTLVGVCALLGGVTLAACLIPAVRAARVDPSMALRSE
ncbi:MAG: ADOP family duplicated permease [bacterium]